MENDTELHLQEKTNCICCGKEIDKYYYNGRGGKCKRKYCSIKCMYKTNNQKKSLHHIGESLNCIVCGVSVVYRVGMSDKIYCIKCAKEKAKEVRKNAEIKRKITGKKKISDKIYRMKTKNCPTRIKKEKEYREKYKSQHNKISRKWEKKNNGKRLETCKLRKLFGTAKIPIEIKKQIAIYRIGERISKITANILNIDNSKIPEIIERINKGETYAAYE